MVIRLFTVYTDISASHKHGIAAFACYMKSDHATIKYTARLTFNKCTTRMEMMAIINALIILKRQYSYGIKKILINTDSARSISILGEGKVFKNPQPLLDTNIAITYASVCADLGNPIIEFRHVKAHTGKNDKRSWLNDWCDVNAKKKLYDVIKRRKNAPKTQKRPD